MIVLGGVSANSGMITKVLSLNKMRSDIRSCPKPEQQPKESRAAQTGTERRSDGGDEGSGQRTAHQAVLLLSS